MCLNGNFYTFCFDFANVTKIAVRKYFSPHLEGPGCHVDGHIAQLGPLERDHGCEEERSRCQTSPGFPGCNCFITGPSGRQKPSNSPRSQ